MLVSIEGWGSNTIPDKRAPSWIKLISALGPCLINLFFLMWVIVFKRALIGFKVEEYYDYECHGPTFLESQCVTMWIYDVKGVVEGFMLLSRSFENGAHITLCESKVSSSP